MLGIGLSKKSRALLMEAEMALLRGEVEVAFDNLNEVCEFDSLDPDDWNRLGALYGKRGRHETARDCFNHAWNLSATSYKAMRGLAVSEMRLGNFEKCLELCDQIPGVPGGIAADIRKEATLLAEGKSVSEKTHIDYDAAIYANYKSNDDGVKKSGGKSKVSPRVEELDLKDIVTEIAEHAYSIGILPSSEVKIVPELLLPAANVTERILMEVQLFSMREKGKFDLKDMLTTILAFCMYAGIGAVMEWHRDWPALEKKGIIKALTRKRGFEVMDEYVTELYTGKRCTESVRRGLQSVILKVLQPAVQKINHVLLPDTDENARINQKNLGAVCIASYWSGVSFAMYKVCGR